MNLKKTLSLLLVMLSLLSVFAVGVSASDIGIQPLWDNTRIMSCRVYVDTDGYGYAESDVFGHFSSNKIEVDVIVYEKNGSDWVYVGEDHVTSNTNFCFTSYQFDVSDGAVYKADFTFTVTKDGVDEVIEKTCYSE